MNYKRGRVRAQLAWEWFPAMIAAAVLGGAGYLVFSKTVEGWRQDFVKGPIYVCEGRCIGKIMAGRGSSYYLCFKAADGARLEDRHVSRHVYESVQPDDRVLLAALDRRYGYIDRLYPDLGARETE